MLTMVPLRGKIRHIVLTKLLNFCLYVPSQTQFVNVSFIGSYFVLPEKCIIAVVNHFCIDVYTLVCEDRIV